MTSAVDMNKAALALWSESFASIEDPDQQLDAIRRVLWAACEHFEQTALGDLIAATAAYFDGGIDAELLVAHEGFAG